MKQLPKTKSLQPKSILDKKLYKKTKGHEYFQYLLKWKDHPIEDASWMTDVMPQNMGSSVEEFMDRIP